MAALRYYLERLALFEASSSLDTQEKQALNRILTKLYEALQFTFGKWLCLPEETSFEYHIIGWEPTVEITMKI